MKLFFDTNVWIQIINQDAFASFPARARNTYLLRMHAVVAAELIAGCRSRIERAIIDRLLESFVRTDRLRAEGAGEIVAAGRALSQLRERGQPLRNPGGALVDAIIAVGASREGALLVSDNAGDFEKLARVLPLRWATLAAFTARL